MIWSKRESTKWFFVYLIPGSIRIWKCWFLRKGGNPKYPGNNLSEQGRESTTNL